MQKEFKGKSLFNTKPVILQEGFNFLILSAIEPQRRKYKEAK